MDKKTFDFWCSVLRHGERKVSPVGEKLRPEYQLVIEPDGNRHLEQTGVKDTYAITQSYKQACSIEQILRRAQTDPTVLQQTPSVYGDMVAYPSDLISATAAVRRAEALYKNLPVEAREKYGTFSKFVESFGTLEGIQKFVDNIQTPSADHENQIQQSTQKNEVTPNE